MTDKADVIFVFVILDLGLSVSRQLTVGGLNETKQERFPETKNSTLPVLSRKRRYVVFPKGSSIQPVGARPSTYTRPYKDKRFELGIVMGLAWMLPSEAHELYLQKRDVDHNREALARAGYGVQHRLDLYKMLEGALNVQGLKGRDCIMRAVCEASKTKQGQMSSREQNRGTVIEELHKTLFL